MSLDVYLTATVPTCVFSANITHNLNRMAAAAGIYEALWRPEEINATKAVDIIERLQKGLEALRAEPARFRAFNPENGWGNYEALVNFVERYLEHCKQYPEADIRVSR
jgi:hypothetical protein